MTKRILIFSLAYYPKHVGGAEIAIKEITDQIDHTNYEWHLIALRFDNLLPKQEQIGNVTVHRVGWFTKDNPTAKEMVSFPMYFDKVLYPVYAFFKARSLDKQQKFDACWSMMSYMVFPVTFLKLLYRRHWPHVITLQEGDPYDVVAKRLRIRLFGPLLKYAFTQAAAVTAISRYLTQWATQLGYQGVVELIPNGVDVETFSKSLTTDRVALIRTQYGFQSNDVVLVSTSRMVHKNAHDVVIESLTKLPTNVKYLLVGDGPLEAKLKQQANKLNVLDRVVFAGHRDPNQLPDILQIANIFIRPSRTEGMGNSFIEAMAAGLPVIATQVGGIADFLFDRARNFDQTPTGFAVDVDNPEQVAEQVQYILDHPDQTLQTTKNAFVVVKEKYQWTDIAEKMFGVFAKVTEKP